MPSALRRLPVVVLSSFALSAIVGVGCKAPPPPPPPVVTIDLAAINAAVPVAWKQKIVFAQRELTAKSMSGDVTYTLAAPTAWTADSMQLPGSVSVHPPYGLDSGFNNFTGLKIGSSCEGACVPKDWAAVAAKGFSKFGEGAEERVVRDEKKATSHLRITETKDTTYLEYAFWYPGSSRYFKCNATLGVSQMPDTVDPRPAMAAFEKACQSVNVTLPEPKK